jgi:hypothetical protein
MLETFLDRAKAAPSTVRGRLKPGRVALPETSGSVVVERIRPLRARPG